MNERGKTIYVNEKDGDDTNNGLTPETALLTEAAAVAMITPGVPYTIYAWWDGEAWRADFERRRSKSKHRRGSW